jgi:hypothetical protein
MYRVNVVGRFLARLNIEAFVQQRESHIEVQMTVEEYQHNRTVLEAWFMIAARNSRFVMLVEKQRGIAEV